MKKLYLPAALLCLLAIVITSCKDKSKSSSDVLIKGMNLKRGTLISCGPPGQEYGTVSFQISGDAELQSEFELLVKLLHSFEYDEAEKVCASIIDKHPRFAMAYWGVAMSNFHPLWTPPTEPELKKGADAIRIAKQLDEKSQREEAYINAVAQFYDDWKNLDHRTRALRFEKGMENLYSKYPTDKEAAVFYALALNAAADPADKTFAKQKKAGALLNELYKHHPNHPGVVHYIIHSYDSPELANQALQAARKYASVAPSSAHALHMPSHIFTRLGLWDEGIQSNLASVASAQCYAQSAGIKGHWDEELHGMDYLMYAYLQKGDNKRSKMSLDSLLAMEEVHPANFKVAYAFAAIPSRYMLENRWWKEAANLSLPNKNFNWKDFPWQKAIIHFTRLMGAVHLEDGMKAKQELAELNQLHQTLLGLKDAYKAGQVAIQIKTGEAWMRFKEGKREEALMLMKEAATMEDKTEKHPVTPGEVIPASEWLADMLLQMNRPAEALSAYEADLQKHPNRLNALYGAGVAAQKTNDKEKAGFYYKQLISIADSSDRPEILVAKKFLSKQ